MRSSRIAVHRFSQAARAVKSRMSRVSGADVPGGSAPFWDDEYLQPEHE